MPALGNDEGDEAVHPDHRERHRDHREGSDERRVEAQGPASACSPRTCSIVITADTACVRSTSWIARSIMGAANDRVAGRADDEVRDVARRLRVQHEDGRRWL